MIKFIFSKHQKTIIKYQTIFNVQNIKFKFIGTKVAAIKPA